MSSWDEHMISLSSHSTHGLATNPVWGKTWTTHNLDLVGDLLWKMIQHLLPNTHPCYLNGILVSHQGTVELPRSAHSAL